MTVHFIPADLFNPGQVLASLGFLEAADILCGTARGGFDWSRVDSRFVLDVEGESNPFEVILDFLAHADLYRLIPSGHNRLGRQKKKKRKATHVENADQDRDFDVEAVHSDTFPMKDVDWKTYPVRIVHSGKHLDITHWCDGSSRNSFKLYSGNRSAVQIARAMLFGTRDRSGNRDREGAIKTKGLRMLWDEDMNRLVEDPFNLLTSLGGKFNFDPRGAWNALDAGYSPNDQKHGVAASPVVELLAALGLDHARPVERGQLEVCYGAWGEMLPPSLARAALGGAQFGVPIRKFRFTLGMSGKNKIVTFAEEEIS